MLYIQATETEFEILDGGHCFVRVLARADNYVEIVRWPARVSTSEAKLLAKWLLNPQPIQKKELTNDR